MPIIAQWNYLKEIYKIEDVGAHTTVTQLSRVLGISLPSVTQQLRALSKKKLVDWRPRGSIKLTPLGRNSAVSLIRKHRVIESFLVKFLAYDPLQAHVEAEDLEHFATDQFINRLERLCGNPKHDPHGDPIPDRTGKFPRSHKLIPLAELAAGRVGKIAALAESDRKLLRAVTDKKVSIGHLIKRGSSLGLFKINGRALKLSVPEMNLIFLQREVRP